jgi:hypothetical protein
MPSFGGGHVVQGIGNLYVGGKGIKHHHDNELMNRLLCCVTLVGSRWFEFLHTWREGRNVRSKLRRIWMTPGKALVWLCVPPYMHGQGDYYEQPGEGLVFSMTFRELNQVVMGAEAAGLPSYRAYNDSSARPRRNTEEDQGNESRARSRGRAGP